MSSLNWPSKSHILCPTVSDISSGETLSWPPACTKLSLVNTSELDTWVSLLSTDRGAISKRLSKISRRFWARLESLAQMMRSIGPNYECSAVKTYRNGRRPYALKDSNLSG